MADSQLISNITYAEIFTELNTFIVNNCDNVGDKFNNISDCFKETFDRTTPVADSRSGYSTPFVYHIKMKENAVYQITNTVISNDIAKLRDTIIPKLCFNGSKPTSVTVSNFNAIFSSILEFCINHLQVRTSGFEPSLKYLIYVHNKNTAVSSFISAPSVINFSDINVLMTYIFRECRKNIRVKSCKYFITCSVNGYT